jgi:phytoene/squalene synthetase
LGYLLCRIVDTIEDAGWSDPQAQERAFGDFDAFLVNAPATDLVFGWIQSFPELNNEGESLLLKDAERVFAEFHALPPEIREILRKPILSMSSGMRHFMTRKAREGVLRLKDLGDVNRYCFFVAGVVGEMLTQLLLHRSSANPPTEKVSLEDAYRFGLFLQKVNILKDQAGDENVGRFLVPSRPGVRLSMLRDAEGALRYLLSIPEQNVGFRLFCGWSLFLGLASLPWIDRSYDEGSASIKIPREEALEVLCSVEERVRQNSALMALYDSFVARLKKETDRGPESASSSEPRDEARSLLSLYRGALAPSQVLSLFS